MSESERTGARNLLYSGWHRSGSLRRFIKDREAYSCSMIDIDACEYCRTCGDPLALIETQQSKYEPKSAKVTARLARSAGIQAFSVSYWPTTDGEDIAGFKVQRVEPFERHVSVMLPEEYARFLYDLRVVMHECAPRRFGDAA